MKIFSTHPINTPARFSTMPRAKNINVSNVKEVEDATSFEQNKAQKKSATASDKKPRVTKFYTDDIEKLLKDLSEMRDKLVADIAEMSEVTNDLADDNMSEPEPKPVSEPDKQRLEDESCVELSVGSGVDAEVIEI